MPDRFKKSFSFSIYSRFFKKAYDAETTAVYKEMHKEVFKIFYWFTNMFVNTTAIYKPYNMCNVCNVYIQNGTIRMHLDLKR